MGRKTAAYHYCHTQSVFPFPGVPAEKVQTCQGKESMNGSLETSFPAISASAKEGLPVLFHRRFKTLAWEPFLP